MATTNQLEQLSHMYIEGYLQRDNTSHLPPEAGVIFDLVILIGGLFIFVYWGLKAYSYFMRSRKA
jgi:hypothetical protein